MRLKRRAWRATADQVEVYATDRQNKGFNAVFLMSVQPDMNATGPRDRQADYGFDPVGDGELVGAEKLGLHEKPVWKTAWKRFAATPARYAGLVELLRRAKPQAKPGDLFATIYTALGVNPRVRHYVGTRPIWATPEGSRPVRALLG